MEATAGKGVLEFVRRGEGPPVLLLHGAMGGYDQGLVLGETAIGPSGFEFVAVSRPGYLGTPLSMGRTPEEQADRCAELLDSLRLDKAAVVAISGGGQCALQFALRHPDRCPALVMISACSGTLVGGVPFRFRVMSLMARFPPLVGRMRKKLMEDPGAAARRSIPDAAMCAQTLNDPVAAPLMRAQQLSVFERMADRLPGTRNDIEQSRARFDYPLEQIRCPALVVHGTADQMVPYALAERLASRVPRGELLTLPGGPHVSLFTHLKVIRERVRKFLGEDSRY